MQKFKKDKGAIDGIIYMMISLFLVVFLLVCFIPCTQVISTKQSINQKARPYLLVMEQKGYLTPENKAKLINDIKEIPMVKSISINSTTTTSKVGYGDWVCLDFTVKYRIDSYVLNSILNITHEVPEYEIIYSEKSTCKG